MASRETAVTGDTGDLERGTTTEPKVRLPPWEKIISGSSFSRNATQPDGTPRSAKVTRLTGGLDSPLPRRPAARFLNLPHVIRGHVISMIGELIGTFSFLFFAFSATQLAVNSNHPPHWAPNQSTSMLLYISLAFGFSLAVNAWTFFRVSGGLFNPAVNLALCLVGALTWTRGALLFVAQIIGALIAASIVSVLFPGDFSVDTTLGTESNVTQGLFIEAFATFELVLVIFMLAAEKHDGRFLAPIGIGIALFVAELSTVAYTGGSLNPARSFAPAVVNHSFPNHHWIYWLGPFMGATTAALVYKLLKVLEYETANPDSVDPTVPEKNNNAPLRQSSVRSSQRRPPTPPVFTLGHRPRGPTDEEEFEDANEWPQTDTRRRLTGFAEGLILPDAQGKDKKKRRSAPD